MKKIRLQIFDLDGTLLKGTSSFWFFFYLLKKKKLPLSTFFTASTLFFSFHLGRLTLAELHKKVFHLFFKGRPQSAYLESVEPFLESYFELMIDRAIAKKIPDVFSVLISSSPDFLVAPIAKKMGIEVFRASEYMVDKEQLFCNISSLVDGQEKLKLAKEIAKELSISQEEISAFSDSDDDIPLLEWVGEAIAVKPNRKLRKVAQKRGWQIL